MDTVRQSSNKLPEVANDQYRPYTKTSTEAEPNPPSIQRPLNYPFPAQSNIARPKVPTIASSANPRVQPPDGNQSMDTTTSPLRRPILVNMSKNEQTTTSNKRSRVKSRRSERKQEVQHQQGLIEASPIGSEVDKGFTVAKRKKRKAKIDLTHNESSA